MSWAKGRWVVAVIAVVLVAEGFARLIDGHVAETDRRGHPELEQKWEVLGTLAGTPEAPEVVAFGNSMMDGAFIPSVFEASPGGAPAFNAAFLNAPLVTIEEWSRMVIDRVEPGVAIVMIHPLDTIEGDGVSFGQDGGTLGSSFDDALSQLDPGPLDRLTERAESTSALVRNRSTLRQPAALRDAVSGALSGDPRPAPQRIDEAAPLHDIDWSQVLDEGGWNSRFQEPMLRADFALDLSFVGDLTLEPTFDAAPVRDVFRAMGDAERAVLVIPPVATEVLDRNGVPASALEARARQLRAVAEDMDVEVVDLSQSDYPIELFHDPVHLSRAGAERFSRELAAAVQVDGA